MGSGLIDCRSFHSPWKFRVAGLGMHLLVVAYVASFGAMKGWFQAQSIAMVPIALGVGIILYGTGRRAWGLLRPDPILVVDGHGVRFRRRGGALQPAPWDRLTLPDRATWEREKAHPIHVRPAPSADGTAHGDRTDRGTWFWLYHWHLQEAPREIQDALEMREDYATPDPLSVPPEPAAPPLPAQPAPPKLETRKSIRDSTHVASQSSLPLGYLLTVCGGFLAEQGLAKGAVILLSIAVFLASILAGVILKRRPARLIVDLGGVSTVGHPRNQALGWDEITGIGQVFTSQGLEFIALFHKVDPAPPVHSERSKPGHPRRLIPAFRSAGQGLPDDSATGWCLIETSNLSADHAEILQACRQGLAWHGSQVSRARSRGVQSNPAGG